MIIAFISILLVFAHSNHLVKDIGNIFGRSFVHKTYNDDGNRGEYEKDRSESCNNCGNSACDEAGNQLIEPEESKLLP